MTQNQQKPAFESPLAEISSTAASRHWIALYTASNQEKRAEQYLRMQEIETFLPLYSTTRRWKNRTTAKLQLPLFSGYVFAKIARTERCRVLAAPMVRWIVGNGREPSLLPDCEIDTLRSGLQLRQADPYPYLKAGDRVRIRSGALAGMEGLVLYKAGPLRVVLSIDSIMQSFAVHVDADELECC
jgi:transcription antitermination factor NusG